ncbi:hypothetical protein COU60_05420 [Candidatus Pacearchaeota archaeon CG10_big_fil_rev_8_21_14_0_10_34_76]|nr:MAG: hypothetical protein COU60_05420 [Candidatus Pacearchaeota archaeon CG10_big_fil_rev_8_21_14_0_10_34_76]
MKKEEINILRRVYGVLTVLVLLTFYLFMESYFIYFLVGLILLSLIFDIGRVYKNKAIENISKYYPKEKNEGNFSDLSIFLIFSLVLALIVPKGIFILSLLVFIVSDNIEHIVGVLYHRGPLFWNRSKSWSGFISGFLVSLTILYLLGGYFDIIGNSKLIIGVSFLSALAGTSNFQDNLLIPGVVSLGLVLS